MSPRTISRQIHRHEAYEIDGQPLVVLVEDDVEGSDGTHRTRYRYKVPFIEQGGTLAELLGQVAAYEPPGVAEGKRDKPGGDPRARDGYCNDCGAPLEQEVTIRKRVQRLEHSIITCTGCGTVTDEGEHVIASETHTERIRHFRLDLPELPRDHAAKTSSAIMAELPLDPSPAMMADGPIAPAVTFTPVAVEDGGGATPCPVVAAETSSAIMAEVLPTPEAAPDRSPAIMAEVPLDLDPDRPRSQPAASETSSAIMAELPVDSSPAMMAAVPVNAPAVSLPPLTVEDEVRATSCPVSATDMSSAMMAEVPTAHCARCGKPTRPDGLPSCVYGEPAAADPAMTASILPLPNPALDPTPTADAPALPPGCDHWCPTCRPVRWTGLIPKVARCPRCVRPWRPPDDADPRLFPTAPPGGA